MKPRENTASKLIKYIHVRLPKLIEIHLSNIYLFVVEIIYLQLWYNCFIL